MKNLVDFAVILWSIGTVIDMGQSSRYSAII
jgi:hypothetical protein